MYQGIRSMREKINTIINVVYTQREANSNNGSNFKQSSGFHVKVHVL